ncbi:MAG: hypothetical protein L3J72_04345, partial [Thermoplasmata archaeon]|nr:hypothetical protein [Thermoplasmata archaeon]
EEIAEARAVTERMLRVFHEAMPQRLQEELDRHAEKLARFAPEHPPSQRARQLHSESTRHLRHGRIAESALRLAELSRALADLGEPATAAGPRVAAPEEKQLASLLLKARQLASRVRHLPPGSSAAEEAADEIRAATESLRERRLDDAERALGRLLHTVEQFESGGR